MASNIARLVTREFPYPIAHSYWQMMRARRANFQRQFSHLLDTFEITVRFLSNVVLNNYIRDGTFDAEWNTRLYEKFDKSLSLGSWIEILRETTRVYSKREEDFFMPELYRFYFKQRGAKVKLESTAKDFEAFVAKRNREAHTFTWTEEQYKESFETNRKALDDILDEMMFLTNYELIIPIHIDNDVIENAYICTGHNSEFDEEFLDLSIEIDDVQEENPLLICKDEPKRQLLLYPLSYFYDDPMNLKMELYLYDGMKRKKGNIRKLDFLSLSDGEKFPVTQTIDDVKLQELFNTFCKIFETLLSGKFIPKEAVIPGKKQIPDEWSSSSMLRYAPEKSTTIFPELAERLIQLVELGSNLVIIVGAAGMGKSRLASVLFESDCISDSLPLWFIGKNVEELFESIRTVRKNYSKKRLCIVLDEDHQHPVRDEEFFIEFLKSGIIHTLRGQHTVVFVVRTSTYETLTAQNLLVRADTVYIEPDEELLDSYESWGIDRPLSSEEKKWIETIASDEDGNLISLLVDKVCIPELKRGLNLEEEKFSEYLSIHETVYQGLVASQPEKLRKLVEALCIAGEFATFTPLWLINAVLQAIGREANLEELEFELYHLQQDSLVDCRDDNFILPIYSWRFANDLINESLKSRINRHRGYNRVDLNKIVKSAVRLVSEEIGKSIEKFREALAMWAALATSQKKGILPLAQILSDAASDIGKDSKAKLGIIASIVAAGCWMRDEFRTLEELSHPSLFDAFCLLGEAVAKILPHSLPFEVIHRIIRFGHLTMRSGCASGKRTIHPMWEVTESTIPSLNHIGKACTKQGSQQVFDATRDYETRRRYVQLLMWAGKWSKAGKVLEKTISDSVQKDLYLSLGLVNLVSCAYLEAQDVQEAQKAYERGADLAHSMESMKSLANMFEMNAKILSKWQNEGKKWLELMAEWKDKFSDKWNEESKVAIIANYPEHTVGSLIADKLETEGIYSQLFYSKILTNLDELSQSWGIVVLGGHRFPGLEELIRPVIEEEKYTEMTFMESEPPAFGVIEFDVSGRPGIWIGGDSIRKTLSAVFHWLETGGVQHFVERFKNFQKNASIS